MKNKKTKKSKILIILGALVILFISIFYFYYLSGYNPTSTMPINVSFNIRYCDSDSDCVRDRCCHPNYLINKKFAPNCSENTLCTLECSGNLDCRLWEPACDNNTCIAQPCTKGMNCSIGKRIK